MTKRAAAYVRVSSEEQTEGWSMDGQEHAIRDYAARNDYEIVSVYTDDVTGSEDKRPGFEQMLMDAHSSLFQAIIVFHTSRLFRNVALARRYKDLLRNKLNIDVIFINQPIVSPDDPDAFMMEGINELFDEYYLHQLRFWTSLGKQTRAQQGMWNGTLPFGYITDPETGLPVPHPQNAQGLVMAFEAYSTGRYSDQQIADLLNREGYRTTGNWGERLFTKDTVNRMLRNVFYLGQVKYKGQTFPGQQPPLIDEDLFDKCQQVRAARHKQKRALGQTKLVYVLAGLARCHICGLTLRCYATSSKGQYRYMRHTAEVRGYTCTVPTISLRADMLEAQWGEIVSRIQLPADWKQRIEQLSGNGGQRATILREREQIQEKLRRIKQLYRDLLVDDDEYRTTVQKLQDQLAGLVLPDNPKLNEAVDLLNDVRRLWEAATLIEQRDLTRIMLKAVYVDLEQGRIVAIEPQPMFRMLLQSICEQLGVEVR
jgi:DNA invertase Pin-like site-specific DNA recombinase/TusA-related sulfurtransferase